MRDGRGDDAESLRQCSEAKRIASFNRHYLCLPNPDAIEEFKVQTGLYGVSFGEHGGASVSLVTKSGTSSPHGSAFEFLRNDVLNANDFFLNRTGEQRPVLKQNQFGLTIGGPFRRDRLYYFGSYQGTRQTNGLASVQARLLLSEYCHATSHR